MKKFSEAVLAKHKHMSHKASPFHAHSQGLEYTPSGKAVVRPIDTADAGYGDEAVSDAEGGEADAGKASKKAVSPMKMQTLVKKTANEETERERLMKLRSFVHQNRLKGMGEEKVDEGRLRRSMRGYAVLGGYGHGNKVRYQSAGERSREINVGLDDKQEKENARRAAEADKAKMKKEEAKQVDEAAKGPLHVVHVSFTNLAAVGPHRSTMNYKVHAPDKEAAKRYAERDLKHKSRSGLKAHSARLVKEEAEQVDEARRMSAAEKLGRAFDSEQQKSADSRRRAQEYMAKIRADVDTKMKKDKEEVEQVDELKKSTLASYAKKATDDVSYHSFMAGTMSSKDPERLVQDKKAMKRQAGVIKAVDKMAKEEIEQVDDSDLAERNMENKAKKDNVIRQVGTHALIKHGMDAGSAKMTGRKVMSNPKFSSGKVADMYRKLPTMKEENDGTEADQGEYGYEGDMAMSQLKSIIRNAKGLHDLLEPQTDLPEWVQSKITLAADYIQTAADYWRSEKEEAMTEGKMKDIATSKAEAERILGGPVKPKASAVGGKGQPKNLRNLVSRLATKAMKAGHSVTEEEKKSGKVPRIGPMEKALEEEEVWDKPMPDSKKQGSLSPEQKAKAKARAERAGRSYPNMIDNMWASKQ